jgi:hypothetical protein
MTMGGFLVADQEGSSCRAKFAACYPVANESNGLLHIFSYFHIVCSNALPSRICRLAFFVDPAVVQR